MIQVKTVIVFYFNLNLIFFFIVLVPIILVDEQYIHVLINDLTTPPNMLPHIYLLQTKLILHKKKINYKQWALVDNKILILARNKVVQMREFQ